MIVQCMWCGRVKDSLQRWNGKQGELMVHASHGICPACAMKRYGIKLHRRGDENPHQREQSRPGTAAAVKSR